MFLFRWFSSFLPLRNPIGFGAADFIELALAAMLILLVLASRLEPLARKFAEKTAWCMLALAALPVALRLLLLPHHPIPPPNVADDFSYVLLADTLSHLRLANPPHPLHQFFETFFVLQEPSYSSIFPMGQGLALALGKMILGHPWAGVALSIAAFCALCYWMLRAWTTPGWALAGGVLAAIQFGPLNQWMNSYWGGAVSASAGCLVFGSLPRLKERGRTRDAVVLGVGLGLEWLARPYESILLVLSVLLFSLPMPRRFARVAAVAALAAMPAIALTLLQNKQITGSWTTLPYALSRYQYGVPTTFTVQANPVPHSELTREQQLDYELQSKVHGENAETVTSYFERLASRARFYRFFFLAPLYLALPAFLLALREFRFAWLLLTVLMFAAGTNFYPYFYSHYIAAVACLFVLMSVAGLERLARLTIRGYPAGRDAARLIFFLSIAHFLFWYGVHAIGDERAVFQYETWDAINHGEPEARTSVNHSLAEIPGEHLVFVRYYRQHTFDEWVYNPADIDRARIVWARDLGPSENEKLRQYYAGRTEWLLEPDFRPPRLTPYRR